MLLTNKHKSGISLNYTRCQRPDGSHYGTAGVCRQGREVPFDLDIANKAFQQQYLTKDKLIGEGEYGKVYDIGNNIVVKIGKISKNEIEVMEQLRSIPDNPTPRLIAVSKAANATVMAMEKSSGRPIIELSPRESTKVYDQILPTLHKIHRLGISHNDLHEGNVFFNTKTKSITILDFGLAKQADPLGQLLDLKTVSFKSSNKQHDKIASAFKKHRIADLGFREMSKSQQQTMLNNVWRDINPI